MIKFDIHNTRLYLINPQSIYCHHRPTQLYLLPIEAEFNVEQHVKSPPGELLGNFFIAEKSTIGFSMIDMLGRYLRKYGVQNTRDIFQYFKS